MSTTETGITDEELTPTPDAVKAQVETTQTVEESVDSEAAATIDKGIAGTRKVLDRALKAKVDSSIKQTELPDGRIQLETTDGKKFFLVHITDPESPLIDSMHDLLAQEFGSQEIEDKETTQKALQDAQNPNSTEFRLAHVLTDAEGKVVGLMDGTYSAPSKETQGELDNGMYFGGYIVATPEVRKMGLGRFLAVKSVESAGTLAEQRGEHLEIIGSEAVQAVEATLNTMGCGRVYFQTPEGTYEEFKYYYPPQEYNPNTGESADPNETPESRCEHFMLRSIPKEQEGNPPKTVTAATCIGTAHRIFIQYSSCWPRERFNSDAAFNRSREISTETLERMRKQLTGVQTLTIISKKEREKLKAEGKTFIEHTEPDKE